MRTRDLATAALLLALAASPAFASTPNTGPKPYGSEESGAPPAEVTRSVELVIAEIREEDYTLVVENEDGRWEITLDESVALRARKKKHFDGRKKLSFADLAEGQEIKLTYLTDSRRILRIDVLRRAET